MAPLSTLLFSAIQAHPHHSTLCVSPSWEPRDPQWDVVTGEGLLMVISGLVRRLQSLGITADSRVVMLVTDLPWAVEVELALWTLGATTVWPSQDADGPTLAAQIEDSEACSIVTDDPNRWDALTACSPVADALWPVLGRPGISGVTPLLPAESDLEFLQQQQAFVVAERTATVLYTGAGAAMHRVVLRHDQLSMLCQRFMPCQRFMLCPGTHTGVDGAGGTALFCAVHCRLATRLLLCHMLMQGVAVCAVTSGSDWGALLRAVQPSVVVSPALQRAHTQWMTPRNPAMVLPGWAFAVCRTTLQVRGQGRSPSRRLRLQHALAVRWLQNRLQVQLGGRLQCWLTDQDLGVEDGAVGLCLAGVSVHEQWGISLPQEWSAHAALRAALSGV